MTIQEIINKTALYTGDTTELSSDEMLSLANKINYEILTEADWEFLRTPFQGTINGTELILPTNFDRYAISGEYTYDTERGGNPNIVRTSQGKIYIVVNKKDALQYNNNHCYFDKTAGKLIFLNSNASGETAYFNYWQTPQELTLTDTPVLPPQFHNMYVHGMVQDDMFIQLFDKARAYTGEHALKYNNYLGRLKMWNAKQNIW